MNSILRQPDAAYQAEVISQLTERYPMISSERLGESLCGRPITLLRIVEDTSERGAVLFAGGFHGSEWLTGMLLLNFADRLCEAMTDGRTLACIHPGRALKGRSLCIIPYVNPDGVEISLHGAQAGLSYEKEILRICGGDTVHWKANAHGVDINHNFDAGWALLHKMELDSGIAGPAPTQYGGASPESEPETQLLTKLCRNEYFRHVVAFHSQGEEIYWHYGEHTHPSSLLMGRILSVASGYELCMPSGLASHGGFKDWFIEQFCRPGFTVEIGKGENPLPVSALDGIYKQLEEMLLLAALM